MVNSSNLNEEQLKELAFTEAERKELELLRTRPIVYDEDCPPVTPEQVKNFKRGHLRRAAQS